MQMRLAFAVAAQLEPEILLVDEVLAVGDLEFQKKCLGKMSEVSKGGRTIVFVSHQMGHIRRLCERVIWVDRGVIKQDVPTFDVVSNHEATFARQLEVDGLGKQDLGRGVQFVKWNSLSSTNRLLEIQNIGQKPPLIADGVRSGNASVCRINT